MLFQWIVSSALLGIFVLTWRRVKQGAIGPLVGILWSMIWIAAGAVIWRPEVTTIFAQFFGIGRGVDLILYSAVILLTFGVFSLALAIDRLERRLSKFVEEHALEVFHRKRS